MMDNTSEFSLVNVQDGSARVVGKEITLNGERGVCVSVDDEFQRRDSIWFYLIVVLFFPLSCISDLFSIGELLSVNHEVWILGMQILKTFEPKGFEGFYRFDSGDEEQLLMVSGLRGYKLLPDGSFTHYMDFKQVESVTEGLGLFKKITGWTLQLRKTCSNTQWRQVTINNGEFKAHNVTYTRLEKSEVKTEMVVRCLFDIMKDAYNNIVSGNADESDPHTNQIRNMAQALCTTYDSDFGIVKCPSLLNDPGAAEFGTTIVGLKELAAIGLTTTDLEKKRLALASIKLHNSTHIRAMKNFLDVEGIKKDITEIQKDEHMNNTEDGHSTADSESTTYPPIPMGPTNVQQDTNAFGPAFQQPYRPQLPNFNPQNNGGYNHQQIMDGRNFPFGYPNNFAEYTGGAN